MISTSFRIALSALFFAGALALATTGAAEAQSIMKQCGDEWKAAKANNTTNGMTWQEFLKQCRTQKADAPRSPPAASARRGSRRLRRLPLPRRPRSDIPAKARARANGGSPDRRRPIHFRGGSEGALPHRHRGLGQHQVPHLSLCRHAQLRHDQAGRLHVPSRRKRRGRSRVEEQNRSAEAAAVSRRGPRRGLARNGARSARAWASKRRGRAKARRALAARSESRRQTDVLDIAYRSRWTAGDRGCSGKRPGL